MKRITTLVLIVMFFMHVLYASAKELNMEDISFGKPINYGSVVFNTNTTQGIATIQDGKPIGLCTVPGHPSWLNIIDLNTMTRIDALEIPNCHSATERMMTDSKGDVWFGSSSGGRLYKYSTSEKKITDYGKLFSETVVMSMTMDEEENIYMGTFPSARIIKFDRKTEKMVDLGKMIPEDMYLQGLTYYKGKLYFQDMKLHKGIYVYDISTEKIEKIIPFATAGETVSATVSLLKDRLVLSSGTGYIKFYNLIEEKWETPIGPGVKGERVTPLYEDGVTFYFFKDGFAYEGNIETKEIRKLENLPYGSYMRGCGVLFELDDPEMPGLNYFNIQYAGNVQVWNFQNQKVKDVTGTLKGTASETRSYGFGPDGRFYVGEYKGVKMSAVDLETMEIESFHMAQPEGFTSLGDKMYFGCYTGAELYILDTKKPYYPLSQPDDPNNNPRVWGNMGDNQDRPFAAIATEDKVVFGTVPGYGEYGGEISIYDPETDKVDSYRHLVKNQMPISLAYKNGLLYVGTSVAGGTGTLPIEKDAHIFIFDMKERKVIKDVQLKIPGVSSHILAVDGISIAPDDTIVGYGWGYIFKMDIETLDLIDYKIWGDVNYGNGQQQWRPASILYDRSGYAFMSFRNMNVINKLAIVDYKTLDYKMTDVFMASNAVMGEDGNIYHVLSENYTVEMIPVVRGEDYTHLFIDKTVFKEGNNNAIIRGNLKRIDDNINVAPYKEKSRMMIPLRFLAEALKFDVTYDSSDKTATIYNENTKIKLKADSCDVYINGKLNKLIAPPEIKNNRLFVHSRTLAELLGKKVYWDESDTVVIYDSDSDFNIADNTEFIKIANNTLKGGSNE